MHLDDLRHELQEIAAEAPPNPHDASSVVRPAARRLLVRRTLAGCAVLAVCLAGIVAISNRHEPSRVSVVSPTGPSGATTTTTTTTKTYALLVDPAWTLKSAVDPPADDPVASIEQPPVDWYAEYERSSPLTPGGDVIGQSVRISGHATTLAQTEALLAPKGFKTRGIDVKGWRAVQLQVPGDTPQAIIVLDRGTSVLMLLSYQLTIEELTRLASTIRLVDRSDWISAGGVVQLPTKDPDGTADAARDFPGFLPAPGWETVKTPETSSATAANVALGPGSLAGDMPWDTVERLEDGDVVLFAMFIAPLDGWADDAARGFPPRSLPLSLDDALTDINFEGQPDHIYAERLGATVNGLNIDLLIFYGGGDPSAVPPVRRAPSAETRAAAQEQLARLVVPERRTDG